MYIYIYIYIYIALKCMVSSGLEPSSDRWQHNRVQTQVILAVHKGRSLLLRCSIGCDRGHNAVTGSQRLFWVMGHSVFSARLINSRNIHKSGQSPIFIGPCRCVDWLMYYKKNSSNYRDPMPLRSRAGAVTGSQSFFASHKL